MDKHSQPLSQEILQWTLKQSLRKEQGRHIPKWTLSTVIHNTQLYTQVHCTTLFIVKWWDSFFFGHAFRGVVHDAAANEFLVPVAPIHSFDVLVYCLLLEKCYSIQGYLVSSGVGIAPSFVSLTSKVPLQWVLWEHLSKYSTPGSFSSSGASWTKEFTANIDIIESVDSICRDSVDTQYMLIQISQNSKTANL